MPVWPPFICHTWYYTAQDDDLEQWELQPRFRLPRHYRQLEVPSLVQRRDWYYLFVSSQDRPQETDNAAKCEWPRSPHLSWPLTPQRPSQASHNVQRLPSLVPKHVCRTGTTTGPSTTKLSAMTRVMGKKMLGKASGNCPHQRDRLSHLIRS